MLTVLGSVRAPTIQRLLPIARHSGMRNRFWCSKALAMAMELCRQTTSTRCAIAGARRLSSICSTISAPTAGSAALARLFRIVLLVQPRAGQRQHGHRLRVRFVDVLLDGLLDLRGHVPRVARVPDRPRRVATTAEASRASKRMVLERLSKTSWPLTASITHLLALADRPR